MAATTASPKHQRRLALLGALLLVAASGAFLWWQLQPSDRQRGLALAQQQRYADAEPFLVRAFERNPNDVMVVIALTLSQVKQNKIVADAEPYMTRWCELEPDNVQPLQLRMDLWQRLKRYDRAIDDGRRILELKPKDDGVRREVARLLLLSGRLDEAERECLRCLDRQPRDSDLLHLRAEIERLQGRRATALALVEEVLSRHPDFRPAWLTRGILLVEEDQPEKAIPVLRQVIARDPDAENRQTARYHLGQALARTGQPDEAAKVISEMRRRQQAGRLLADSTQQPGNAGLQVEAAGALLEFGENEEALKLLEGVLRRDENFAAAHRALADYYASQGQAERAAVHRRRAGL